MQRRERQSCGAIRTNEAARMAQIEWFFFFRAKNLNFGGYQELALAVTSLWAEAENPKQQWRTNLLWLNVGTRRCIYIFLLLQKQEYILQRDWSCLAEAPPMTRIRVCCVVNFTFFNSCKQNIFMLYMCLSCAKENKKNTYFSFENLLFYTLLFLLLIVNECMLFLRGKKLWHTTKRKFCEIHSWMSGMKVSKLKKHCPLTETLSKTRVN